MSDLPTKNPVTVSGWYELTDGRFQFVSMRDLRPHYVGKPRDRVPTAEEEDAEMQEAEAHEERHR